MSEIDELLLKQNLSKEEVVYHVYKAVKEYDAYMQSKRNDFDQQTKNNIKTLIGLLTYNKFDINNLNAELTVTLFVVMDWYQKIIEEEKFANDNILDKLATKLDKIVEEDDKKVSEEAKAKETKVPLTDEKLIAINRVNNKKVLDKAGIDQNGRRIIYQMIEKCIDKYCVRGEKGKALEYKTKYYHLKFIAKKNEKGEYIYKINEINRITGGRGR